MSQLPYTFVLGLIYQKKSVSLGWMKDLSNKQYFVVSCNMDMTSLSIAIIVII